MDFLPVNDSPENFSWLASEQESSDDENKPDGESYKVSPKQ